MAFAHDCLKLSLLC